MRNKAEGGRRKAESRRGATTVELAVVLMVFLTIIFGMMDLSLAVLRYHVTSQSARQAARIAIIHGELAPPEQTTWGTTTVTTNLDADSEVPNAVRPYITSLDPAQTTLTLEWPDGNTRVGSKVTATVQTQYTPIITFLFSGNFTITAQSTMQIAH